MSQSPFSEAISKLKPKEKEPQSARVLDPAWAPGTPVLGWVVQSQQAIGGDISGTQAPTSRNADT